VGFLYQNQAFNISGVLDPLFGHQLLPNSRLSIMNPAKGESFGDLLTNSAGFVKNNSRSQDEEPTQAGDFVILVTGGSTVAGPGVEKNEHTFPSQLEAWFAQNWQPRAPFKRIKVLNGGVVGYNASQELVRFLFDYSRLKPQAWLQLSGTNEAWSFGELGGGILSHYNRRFLGFAAPDPVLRAGIFPALQKLWAWAGAKIRPNTRPLLLALRPEKEEGGLGQRFLDTIEQSRVAAEGEGLRHFFVLQPSGIFSAALSGHALPSKSAELSPDQWPKKISDAEKFLGQVRPLLAGRKNFIDGTRFLDGVSPVPYID
jgi:hypothetical protein